MNFYKALRHLHPDLEDGKDFILKDNSDGKGVYILEWKSTRPKPSSGEIVEAWNQLSLEELKHFKYQEIDEKCESTILGRFKSTLNGIEYEFSYDDKAQSRFNGIATSFTRGYITEIEWTAYLNGERTSVLLNEEQFDVVAKSALMHTSTNIAKFREKFSQLESATTVTQVQAIVW